MSQIVMIVSDGNWIISQIEATVSGFTVTARLEGDSRPDNDVRWYVRDPTLHPAIRVGAAVEVVMRMKD